MLNTIKNDKSSIPYTYKNLPIPGGGFVTGFLFHPRYENILYARTDIGGVYRYDFSNSTWISLMDHVTNLDLRESYPLAIALDNFNKDSLYIACGDGKSGILCISYDKGEHFIYRDIPCGIHGNAPGRGTGDRLILDPNNSQVIYFASQTNGLYRSLDEGVNWEPIRVCTKDEQPEYDLTSMFIDPRSTMDIPFTTDAKTTKQNSLSTTLIVSTSGVANRKDDLTRGHCLYISTDCGQNFKKLEEPNHTSHSNEISGLVAKRMAFDSTYLYITMGASGAPNFSFFSNYSCDSGNAYDGRLIRYRISSNGSVEECIDVTPDTGADLKNCGLSGICVNPSVPGFLLCTTICKKDGDIIFISKDSGITWTKLLSGLTVGNINFTVPYMKPEYNGNSSIIHWVSDIKINPFNKNHAVFNTGTGIFMTENLLSDHCTWEPSCKGLEETVHLNIYSPPSGDVKLLDILGDLGGFAFTDLDTPPENTFADKDGNRYITCMNADFPENNPSTIVITPRGNWTGKTTGGLLITKDQCKTFHLLSHPYGISTYIDELLNRIKRPNINSGWTAISSDSRVILWSIADGYTLPANAVVYTLDEGRHWEKSKVYHKKRKLIKDNKSMLKVMSDRINPSLFYGFGEDSSIYLSKDSGKTFYEYDVIPDFPKQNLGTIDGRNRVEIRLESGKEGVIWIAMGSGGLWRLFYNRISDCFEYKKITNENEYVYSQGMGKGKDEYSKTLYICGVIDGEYGFYRSFDEGSRWERINNNNQMYGDVRSMTGDPRVFGRVYIATGSRGVLYGEESY